MQYQRIGPHPKAVPLRAPEYKSTPSVSVLLPVYNESLYVERCLKSLLAQDYPADHFEILVIDGRSTDNTRALVTQIQEQTTGYPSLQLLDNADKLQAHALNIGLQAARGDILVRVDGHTLLSTTYVRRCIETLRELADQGVVNVGGRMMPVGETPIQWAIAAATRSPFSVPTAFHHSAEPQFVDTVSLGAWPRQVFDVVGGFNPAVNINEDYELNYRIRQVGGKIYLSPSIQSVYFCRGSFAALARQYFRYGKQKVQMLKQHPTAIRVRQLIPPLFVLGVFLGPALGLLWSGFVLLWASAITVYIALALLMATSARRAVMATPTEPLYIPDRHPSLFHVLAAFVTIHIAWGTGFWAGWTKAK